jgi:hypothetical protein
MNKNMTYIYIGIISLLVSSFSGAEDIEFFVEALKDKMKHTSVYSKDASYFSSKGSENLSIYSLKNNERIGFICCQRGFFTNEFFIHTDEKDDRLLQIKRNKNNEKESISSIYNMEGVRLIESKEIKSDEYVAISRSKNIISAINREKIKIYDSYLRKINEYSLKSRINKVDNMAISNGATSALVKSPKSFIYINFEDKSEVLVGSCFFSEDYDIKISPYESSKNRFFVMSQFGDGCIVSQGKGRAFKVSFTGKIIDIYASKDLLFLVTSSSIFVFDGDSFAEKANFELAEYYEIKFGKPGPYEYPLFDKSEFDWSNSTFYLRGHSSTKTFYKIKLGTK